MKQIHARMLLSLAGVVVLCSTVVGDVSTTQSSPSRSFSKSALKAYCGVRCLYAAAIVEGVPLSPADLVRPEYIGSREGSSIEELERAASEHGLHTFEFANGSITTLAATSHPVILHVESLAGTGRYDHFVLYLGRREQKLLILDTTTGSGEPARAMAAKDLELIWNGAGVIVSKTPIDGGVPGGSLATFALYGIGIILLVSVGKAGIVSHRVIAMHRSLGTAGELLAILTAALAAPALSALCADSGLLAHQAQIEQVEQTHAAYFLPRMSFAQAQAAIESNSATFVDARYASDYAAGHLQGAMNVPVSASDQLVRLLMQSVPKNQPLVVYCESKACPFSKSVATILLQEGFTSVELLDGGWEEWSIWKH